MTLARTVTSWPDGDRRVLWSRLTGRHLVVPPEALDELERPERTPLRRRLADLGMLAEAPLDPGALIPARSHLVLLLPDEPTLWLPVPEARTAGGSGYRARPLEADELRIWRETNDSRTVSEVARRAAVPVARALAFFGTLTTPEVQAVQLRDRPPHPRDPSLGRLLAPPRPDNLRTETMHGDAGETDLLDYHLCGITDGGTHFDDRETTLAHALALPHPALGGQRYGARLHDVLAARGLVPERGTLLEVGCGTGELAAAFRERAPDALRYVRLDLSPELLRTQARNAPGTHGLLGDAVRLPIADASVDLVVSNEVIADLAAVPHDPAAPRAAGAAEALAERLARYGIDPLDGPALYNLGAWQLLEEVARVLRPGGAFAISEFGDLEAAPEEARQLDHPEVSIHFGHLLRVARCLGLEADVLPLPALLHLDPTARWIARPAWEAVRALARSRGLHLEARAWDARTLADALPFAVEGIREAPLSEPGPGPLPARFYALVGRRAPPAA